MNEVIMLLGDKPKEILQSVIDERIPVAISFLSDCKWRLARAMITELGDNVFTVEISPRKKTHSADLKIDQLVGMSFKYGYGAGFDRFVFGTAVIGVEQSADGGKEARIILAVPEEIEVIRGKSYLRIDVPQSFDIDVQLWHRSFTDGSDSVPSAEICQAWQGKLIDICADGLQVSVDYAQGPDLKKGQYVGIQFTPMPHETSLTCNAYISDISFKSDSNNVCFDLQIVGLEASPEGRMVLQRLCSIAEQYLRMQRPSSKVRNTQTVGL